MIRAGDIAVLATTGCDAFAALSLLRGDGVPALALHVLACGVAAALLHGRLLRGPAPWSFALIFGGALLLPGLGLLGVLAVALASARCELVPEGDCQATRIPRPPGRIAPETPRSGREARLAGVTALRGSIDPEAVRRLRRALEDRDEDVRLLAHSLLESKSRAACRRIDETIRALEQASESQRGPLHRRLALEQWDLAWLGLVQGECLDYSLAAARRHAVAAIGHDPRSPSLHFLLGRIELRLNAPERAEAALIRSNELGLPRHVVRPYLAEAAFARRRFDLVRKYLGEPGPAGPNGVPDRLRRFWT